MTTTYVAVGCSVSAIVLFLVIFTILYFKGCCCFARENDKLLPDNRVSPQPSPRDPERGERQPIMAPEEPASESVPLEERPSTGRPATQSSPRGRETSGEAESRLPGSPEPPDPRPSTGGSNRGGLMSTGHL